APGGRASAVTTPSVGSRGTTLALGGIVEGVADDARGSHAQSTHPRRKAADRDAKAGFLADPCLWDEERAAFPRGEGPWALIPRGFACDPLPSPFVPRPFPFRPTAVPLVPPTLPLVPRPFPRVPWPLSSGKRPGRFDRARGVSRT